MKRDYPLFIIDTQRSHGRGREIDYLTCTSASTPFVAEVSLIDETQYVESYDANNYKVIYSDPQRDIRMRIRIVSIAENHDKAEVRQLLRRALKEVLLRKKTVSVDIADVSNEAVVTTMRILLQQVYENLREEPGDTQQKMLRAVFEKIIDKFNQA